MSKNYEVKCTEMLKLCRSCVKNPLNTAKSSSCIEILNGFCERLRNADMVLADFKYWLVDIKTKKMHENIKTEFSERKMEEEKKLNPIEEAYKKDLKKIGKIENQQQQIKNDIEDYNDLLFDFKPIGGGK